jgi:parallel beta-helix repeat protein
MKKNRVFIIIIIMPVILLLCGCIFLQTNNESETNNSLGHYDFFVNQSYSSDVKHWNVTYFSSINAALERSQDNTSIYVFNGLYYESLIINNSIHLQGEDPYKTIIDSNQMTEDVIQITANGNVKISGFTIRNSSKNDPYAYNEAGIDIRSNGNTIEGNIISNNYFGVYCPYNNNNVIRNNLFTKNIEYGAYFLYRSDNNEISHNVFYENQYCALRIQGSQFNNVTYNVFLKNVKGLYLCCGSKHNNVYGNIFCNNSEWNVNDAGINQWNTEEIGNFWDDFHLDSQGAFDNDSDGIIDYPYSSPRFNNLDNFPLKKFPDIQCVFFEENILPTHCIEE